jgi:hypothetical protein
MVFSMNLLSMVLIAKGVRYYGPQKFLDQKIGFCRIGNILLLLLQAPVSTVNVFFSLLLSAGVTFLQEGVGKGL